MNEDAAARDARVRAQQGQEEPPQIMNDGQPAGTGTPAAGVLPSMEALCEGVDMDTAGPSPKRPRSPTRSWADAAEEEDKEAAAAAAKKQLIPGTSPPLIAGPD